MLRKIPAILAFLPVLAAAQATEDYKGGWITQVDGTTHAFHIVLRDGLVSGFYCHDCQDPGNLAFIDDGSLDDTGLSFQLYHYPPDAAPWVEDVTAVLTGDHLNMTLRREGATAITRALVLQKQTPDPVLDSLPVNPGPPGNRERILPGPAEAITAEKVLGTWLWGAGPGKQIFMFRRHKDGIRGMVCGPCDRSDAMAPLEKISWSGTTLHFEIVHEDGGPGFEEHGSHSNVTDAVITLHEMHMSVIPSYEGADFKPIEMTLLGPVTNW
jgi:hypothetical protein